MLAHLCFTALLCSMLVLTADGNVCPSGNVVDAFYKLEILVGSKASICTDMQNDEIALVLQQIMDQAYQNVPNLIESTTVVCPYPGRRRNLLEEELLSTITDQTKSALPQSDIRMIVPQDNNNDTAMETTPRRILYEYVYRGGSRCTFCLPDNADLRRELRQKDDHPHCRQKVQYLARKGVKSLEAWKNKRLYNHGVGKILLGLYSSGETTSRTFTVPSWADLLRMRLLILEVGRRWTNCRSDYVILELNGERTVIRPSACHRKGTIVKQRKKTYSVASKSVVSSYGLPATRVVVASASKLFKSTRKIKYRLTVKTSNRRKKKAAFGNIVVRVDDTCTSIKPNHINQKKNKHKLPTSTFEQVLEEILTKTVSREFRKYVQKRRNHCLHGSNPTVYVNLFPKSNWGGANPQCS